MAVLKNMPPFEVAHAGAPYSFQGWKHFRVGTCSGLWRCEEESYEILAIGNSQPGNGDFEYTMEYFYTSCRRDGKSFRFREVWNERFKNHLIKKRGFITEGADCIKYFKNGKK